MGTASLKYLPAVGDMTKETETAGSERSVSENNDPTFEPDARELPPPSLFQQHRFLMSVVFFAPFVSPFLFSLSIGLIGTVDPSLPLSIARALHPMTQFIVTSHQFTLTGGTLFRADLFSDARLAMDDMMIGLNMLFIGCEVILGTILVLANSSVATRYAIYRAGLKSSGLPKSSTIWIMLGIAILVILDLTVGGVLLSLIEPSEEGRQSLRYFGRMNIYIFTLVGIFATLGMMTTLTRLLQRFG